VPDGFVSAIAGRHRRSVLRGVPLRHSRLQRAAASKSAARSGLEQLKKAGPDVEARPRRTPALFVDCFSATMAASSCQRENGQQLVVQLHDRPEPALDIDGIT
jgi:hypothetical protein